ncbi:U32 family peptidase [bacterium 1XD21-13]|nr:U32 family peptidase [bacterium 1XD21-13]
MRHTTELLAPAGSFDSLRAAVGAGADAVYLGGSRFGARAYADNFGEQELCHAIDYAHLHGCDIYLTVNTLLKDRELEELGTYLKPYYECGLDAVIVQDFGVLSYIREFFPDLPVHASTQMTILGAGGAAFLRELGAARIVTARELSLEEIRQIHSQVDIEIESFVHGALCYCYSGQCLFSSMLGGRSGNRGRCAQPCRLPYELHDGGRVWSRRGETYLLSPKDMCTIELLPEILEAGVCSLKIEGRMKRPEYTAGVVRIYRKYLDHYLEYGKQSYQVSEEDLNELKMLYNRGGFSRGYYQVRNGRELMSLTRPGHFSENGRGGSGPANPKGQKELREKRAYEALLDKLKREYVDKEKKEKIKGVFRISTVKPTELVVTWKESRVIVSGAPAQLPQNQPMDKKAIVKQLQKTGDFPFVFEELLVEGEERVFLPVRQLNLMRREALARLREVCLEAGRRPRLMEPLDGQGLTFSEQKRVPEKRSVRKPSLHVQIENPETLKTALAFPEVSLISIASGQVEPGRLKEYAQLCHQKGKSCALVLPAIFRSREWEEFRKWKGLLEEAGLDAVIVKNLEELAFLKELRVSIPVILDHNLYTFNRRALAFWKQRGILFDTLPLELNERELALRGCEESEMLVYGYLPLMVTAGCLHKTLKACRGQREKLYLVDRYKKEFPVVNECRWCYNVIYNCEPLSLLGNKKEVEHIAPKSIRISFTVEKPAQIQNILKQYVEVFFQNKEARAPEGSFTRGHLKRGVE